VSPPRRRPGIAAAGTPAIDIAAWRRELAALYPEAFLRSNGNLTISITALGNQPLPFGNQRFWMSPRGAQCGLGHWITLGENFYFSRTVARS
jgi:hypothetical protein